ncbi:MAG: CDP-alcohol phosphatidyltransferase family protein [Oscillospiraceae bacterium]|nr:CDP-alcohol phosphatidyltransferase family protein [Oscillospiraceae bacterium]
MMENKSFDKKIITIPNILSAVRLMMIPLIVWLYCKVESYLLTGVIIILSGITDVVDGFIARHFNMISDVGKVLDPIADKFTQGAVLLCLLSRFPLMLVPILCIILKEIFMIITGFLVIKKVGKVPSADWHGKLATCALYGMMELHILWYDITSSASVVSIMICACLIGLSFVLYGTENIKAITGKKT